MPWVVPICIRALKGHQNRSINLLYPRRTASLAPFQGAGRVLPSDPGASVAELPQPRAVVFRPVGPRGRPETSPTRCSRRLRILQQVRLPSQRRCRGSPTSSGCTALSLKGRANFEDRYLKPSLETGMVELTIPDKPDSRLQRYRLTAKGQAWLSARKPKDEK